MKKIKEYEIKTRSIKEILKAIEALGWNKDHVYIRINNYENVDNPDVTNNKIVLINKEK